MLETNEMIYTAIFQSAGGLLTRSRYTGVINRQEAWEQAASMGESSGECLIALIPGDHPVYMYDDVHSHRAPNTEMKNHDVYEISAD